ncbi:serine hydrolase domain-containing protein [Histidinibacterium aquaticum]|uniref:Serine hydrolase n=1 Tax=Histidinibacterium aquaticum TaxID=2613962 RepID=A0A5J5GFR0_9RHOB|nr:serine hydrolase [Histidinibacterium aquaticum]KAA9006971.1 serine hydrolase [Histidinibacterium aquaticum]
MPTRRTTLALLAAAPLAARAQDAPSDWSDLPGRAAEMDQFHAIAVSHRGEIVLEEAVRGPSLSTPANIKSVSKSVVAALLGAAIEDGAVPSVEATLGEVAPALIPSGADPRVSDLTMEDLVTLRAGLERTSGPNYGGWVASGNWVADALTRPFVAEPGGRMLYSTGSFHVLGAALTEATGESLLALARRQLGDPLGIEIPPWTRDPQGYYMGGNQMALTPAGMIRFGELYRLGGAWEGARVLPAPYVDATFEPVATSPWSGLGYGYGWFTGLTGGRRFGLARGYGGQIVFVMPEAALTIAITSDPNRPARSEGYFGELMDFVTEQVVPLAT